MEVMTTGMPENHIFGDMYNWTELLNSFNSCNLRWDHNIMMVTNFILYLIIFVGGLLGNLLVLCVNWQSSKRWSGINIYILNMALADLGVVLSLPIWMLEVLLDYTWLWGSFLCRFTHYFYFANMYASVFLLAALSVDRYLSMASTSLSWRLHKKHIRKGLCITIWVLAAILPLPEVVHYQTVDESDPLCAFMAPFETYNHWALATSMLTITFGFLIPFPVIAGFNIMTARYIKSSIKPESCSQRRLISAYIIVFFVSWFPYHSLLFFHILNVFNIRLSCYKLNVIFFFYDFLEGISFLHCLANPILYNFFSKNFKGKLITAVVKYAPKEHLVNNQEEQTTSSTSHSIVITNANLQSNSLTCGEAEQASNKPSDLGSTATYL